MTRPVPWLALAAGLVAYRGADVAHACSCIFEGPGRYYVSVDNKLPVSATGIPWTGFHPLSQIADQPRPITDRVTVLRHTVDGRTTPVPFTIGARGGIDLIKPDGFVNRQPGDTYTVIIREYRQYEGMRPLTTRSRRKAPLPKLPFSNEITVTIVADELDLRGATVQLSPRTRQTIRHAEWRTPSCGAELDADTIDLTVALPPALEPYRDYLHYTTVVDGMPLDHPHPGFPQLRTPHQTNKCQFFPPGRTWTVKPGTDRLFSECGEQPYGLTPGEHRLAVTISTPDGGSSFSTRESTFLIGCDLPTPTPPEPTPAPAPPEPEPTPQCPAIPQTNTPQGCSLAAPSLFTLAPLLLPPRRRRQAHAPARSSA